MTKVSGPALALLFLSIALSGCATVPPGSPQAGYSIHGYVGMNSMTPAPMRSVTVLKKKGRVGVGQAQTNLLGAYVVSGLRPGEYILHVEETERTLHVVDADVRIDVDLSAKGGVMNYAGSPAPEGRKAGSGSAARAASPGPNDPGLQKQIAGVWWGFSGSTERRIGLCPDGSYHDFSESGYSGTSRDSLGNQTMAWGTAGQQGGQGRWTIQGTAEQGTIQVAYADGGATTLEYRQIGDPGCLSFNGRTLCRKSAACE